MAVLNRPTSEIRNSWSWQVSKLRNMRYRLQQNRDQLDILMTLRGKELLTCIDRVKDI